MKSVCRSLAFALCSLAFFGCPKPEWKPPSPTTPTPPAPTENTAPSNPQTTTVAVPSLTPLPELFIPRRSYDTARLFNGAKIYSRVESLPGGIAPVERTIDESFSVDISLKVKVPTAMTTLADFDTANPGLTRALPTLGELLAHGKVSPYYHALYALKVRSLQTDLRRLDDLLSRHNFYDCGTILELTNPATGRKALWLQGDMDVVTDGSDSDRLLEVDGSSMHYQPFTSYRWPKRTPVPSQFIAEKQAKISAAQSELALPATTAERPRVLRKTVADLQTEIADLQTFSYLISKADPFIVLPGLILRDRSLPFCPRLGDYVAVIHKDKIYPAIFGDVGPAVKIGEASLRIATALNGRSTANNRATNNLDISYVVFPKSADEPSGPPDYEKWRARCVELLADLGAPNAAVEKWENILPPMPTPTPPPTPTPSPTIEATPASTPTPDSTSSTALPTPKALPSSSPQE